MQADQSELARLNDRSALLIVRANASVLSKLMLIAVAAVSGLICRVSFSLTNEVDREKILNGTSIQSYTLMTDRLRSRNLRNDSAWPVHRHQPLLMGISNYILLSSRSRQSASHSSTIHLSTCRKKTSRM
jgi:hypothetical protein